LFFK